ncbi:MAG: thymidine phosphorylase [Chloroflexi bacterium]|nr:thymidine phosphorylase [Chloroflexota bacterium]
MDAVEIIARKRDGHALTRAEIDFFVHGYTAGRIPDYQASAWLMAVYLNGMNDVETRDLTLAMAESGDRLDLSDIAPLVVDKHSTGGVGDKVSLIVAPVAAACGLPVAKISGRGLGFTGGTLDKLESIPGYRTDLTEMEFRAQLSRIGVVLTGQTGDLAPADGKLYSLRDVTATVASIPLIVGSILSKKIAGGAHAVCLDVKVGHGALMQTLDDARELARALVSHGTALGLRVTALISDMNQPLGHAVGNAIEVREAINVLRGGSPGDLADHCLRIASEMLVLGQRVSGIEEGLLRAREAIESGSAWQKFRELVVAQGGQVRYVDEPDLLPQAPVQEITVARVSGYVAAIQAAEVGLTVMRLGGGRYEKDESIDHGVGVILHRRVGDLVESGDPLFTVLANDEVGLERAQERLLEAHSLTDEPVRPLPLFYDRIT